MNKCEYCNKKKSFEEEANKLIINKSFKNEVDVILEIDRGRLCLFVDNLAYYDKDNWLEKSSCLTSKKINYCPICGRKLGNSNE